MKKQIIKFLKNIYQKLSKRPAFILILLLLLLFPTEVFAQATSTSASAVDDVVKKLFAFLDVAILALQAILWPILVLIGGLLNNDLVFAGGSAATLLNIWSAVRDFVNIMFVLVMLAVAIANIIGTEKQEYQIKAVLPKIVLGLVLVNFSFFGCKVLIDFSNIISTSIFAIPSSDEYLSSGTKNLVNNQTFVNNICEALNRTSSKEGAGSGSATPAAPPATDESSYQKFCEKAAAPAAPSTPAPAGTQTSSTAEIAEYHLTEAGKNFFTSLNSRNISLIMATELMQITEISKVKTKDVEGLKNLTINAIFSIVFFIIYATSFVALFVALTIRMAIVWITTAIMPLSVLGWSFAPVGKRVNEGDNSIWNNFMNSVTMPIKVSLVLSIGIIMITQFKKIGPGIVTSSNPADLGAIVEGSSSLQDIMAGLGIAAFIWLAVKEAIKGGKWSKYTDKIFSTVGGWAETAQKLPQYIPFLPIGKGGQPVGLAGVTMLAEKPRDFFTKEETKYREALGIGSATQAFNKVLQAKGEKPVKQELTEFAKIYTENMDREQLAKIAAHIEKEIPKERREAGRGEQGSHEIFMERFKEGKVSAEEFNKFLGQIGAEAPGIEAEEKHIEDMRKDAVSAGLNKVAERLKKKKDEIAKPGTTLAAARKAKEDENQLFANLQQSLDSLAEIDISDDGSIPKEADRQKLEAALSALAAMEIKGDEALTEIERYMGRKNKKEFTKTRAKIGPNADNPKTQAAAAAPAPVPGPAAPPTPPASPTTP